MTTQQIINIYLHNDRSDRDLYERVKLVETEAECAVICESLRPRHQWIEQDFQLFARQVKRKLQPLKTFTPEFS